MLTAEKSIMSVEGGIEQVETVKLTEKNGIEHVVNGQRIVWILALDLFETRESSVIIEDVEPVERLAHGGVQVERVGINPRGGGDHSPAGLREEDEQGY